MSQKTLSKLSTVPCSTLSEIENGKTQEPSYTTMSKLIRALEKAEKKRGRK